MDYVTKMAESNADKPQTPAGLLDEIASKVAGLEQTIQKL
jgi:hypothetical protein